MSKLVALIAIVALCAFLGILLFEVPRLDLGILIVFTLILAIYDFFKPSNRAR
ncbi:hypothetical protein GCM10007908_18660 [Rhizobium albus]|nr:hypothetical protein GCM10007908_18660 [Rhizobium albus]